MDDQLFDDFTREVGRATGKRAILRLLVTGAVLAVTKARSIPRSPKVAAITSATSVSING